MESSQPEEDVSLWQVREEVTSPQPQGELVWAEPNDVAAIARQEEAPPELEGK
jgi:hypothetical protein